MSDDRSLGERFDDLVEESIGGPVTAGQMFGSRGLRTGRKFYAVWWHERLVLKLPQTQVDGLVAAGEGEPFEPMAGRKMGGWVVVSPATDWSGLARGARTHVEALAAPS